MSEQLQSGFYVFVLVQNIFDRELIEQVLNVTMLLGDCSAI